MGDKFTLVCYQVRKTAMNAVSEAPDGWEVHIKPPQRNNEQNKKLWAMLTDISKQVEYHGKRLNTEDWKSLFTGSLRGFELMPSINNDGFVLLGESTSNMSKARFSELIEMIHAFGDENGVKWSEKASQAWLDYLDRLGEKN